MKLQLLQPTPCFDPAQDLRDNNGSFLWFDGPNVKLIVSKEGHSIKSIRSVATVPEAFATLGNAATRTGTLVKISNADLSEEYTQFGNQGGTTRQ